MGHARLTMLRCVFVAVLACALVAEALPVGSEVDNSLSMIQEDPAAEAAEIKDAAKAAEAKAAEVADAAKTAEADSEKATNDAEKAEKAAAKEEAEKFKSS